jgi:hypothetical protein
MVRNTKKGPNFGHFTSELSRGRLKTNGQSDDGRWVVRDLDAL